MLKSYLRNKSNGLFIIIMKNILFAILVSVSILPVYAQNQDSIPTPNSPSLNSLDNSPYIVPRTISDETVLPSPEAAQMNRYVDYPVSRNTGTADVHIPLYNLSLKDIPFSISMSYHTSGCKVDDIPGVLGLGWTLNAGGCISRVIHGQPDESLPYQLKTRQQIESSADLDYLKDIVHLQKEASPDRYYYNFEGYSGSFICNPNGTITQLPPTNLKIQSINKTSNGIYDFLITTPSGCTYYFTEREQMSYEYFPTILDNLYRSPNYSTVSCWHLSKIVSPYRTDSISLTYTTIPSWRREESANSLSSSFVTTTNGATGTSSQQSNAISAIHRTTFSNQRVLSQIKSRTTTINFTSSTISGTRKYGTPNIRMAKIDIKNTLGNTVRSITFDNDKLFGDKRLRLESVSITSGTKLLDKRTFTYYNEYGSYSDDKKDFFGYSNSGITTTLKHNSILDYSGKLSGNRSYHFASARAFALESIQEPTGAITTYTYEANRCNLFRSPVNIGLRIQSISVTDPVTGKSKTAEFTYENEACTINFDDIGTTAFISLSGVRASYIGSPTSISTGSVRTTSCRIPGYRAENAIIYYGKVTETVSGSGVPQKMKTVYEYDTSNCLHPFKGAGISSNPSLDPDNARYLGTKIYYPNLSPETYEECKRIYGPQFVGGYFQETCWEKAPLIHRTIYKHTPSGYEPIEEEINRYSLDRTGVVRTGFYVESILRTIDASGISKEDFQSTSDFNFFETETACGRLFKDTTITIIHYPNSVSHREVTSYTYNRSQVYSSLTNILPPPLRIILPGFTEDSTQLADHGILQSTKTVCGNQTFEHYYCYSSNITGGFLQRIANDGNISLPVMEKWVINTKDTILLNWQYADFGRGNIRPSRKVLSWNRQETASQVFTLYEKEYPLETILNRLSPTAYIWNLSWNYPIAVVQGASYADTRVQIASTSGKSTDEWLPVVEVWQKPAGSLTTCYDYEPLIGCTKVTEPNGEETNYQYLGGKLSKITDHSKKTIAEYTYTLRGEGAAENSITTRNYLHGAVSYLEQTQYYDGLGQPIQILEKQITPLRNNLLHVFEYDCLGRETRNWLPIPTATNGRATNYANLSANYYGDPYAYTENTHEAAPMEQLLKKTPPGNDFRTHPVTYEYLANSPQIAVLNCNRYEAVNDEQFRCTGTYPAGELEVILTTDEDGHKQYTFTDFRGNTVLIRQVNNGEFYDTYTIHDALGNPLLVLPPMASASLGSSGTWSIRNNEILQKYAYYYRYDARRLCVEKKLPGAEPVYYVYDKTRRLMFSQDGNQRTAGEWTFYLYDKFQRPTVQGVCKNTNTASAASVIINCERSNGNTGLEGSEYSSTFSLASPEVHIVNYYDDYEFKTLPGFNSSKFSTAFSTANPNYVKGYPAGSITKVPGSSTKLYSVNIYDIKGQIIQSLSANHLDGYEAVENTYTFTGKPKTVKHVHTSNESKANKNTIEENYTYNYDHAERITSINYTLGNNTITLATNTYDELGRLKSKSHHGSNANIITYNYNTRGWTKKIESPKFTQKLYYTDGNSTPCYNGNISSMTWKADTEATRGYKFTYDHLNRMMNAGYGEGEDLSANAGRFSEIITGYDRNGNILGLKRNGKSSSSAYGMIDNLTLTYDGNQLKNVTDAATDPLYNGVFNFTDENKGSGTEYLYDSNGNMQQDYNKKISKIQYNLLNLPATLQFTNGNRKDYTYSADGKKLKVVHRTAIANISVPMGQIKELAANQISQTHTVDYCGNVIYENGSLSKVLTEEGYATLSGTTPTFYYYLKDHQGNNRMVVRLNGASWNTEQVNHYYPFGGVFEVNTETSGKQSYKYNGKELDRMHGLDWYDYGARHYDAALGRWHVVDPLADKYYGVSPYVYVANNPLKHIDLNGDSISVVDLYQQDERGNLVNSNQVKAFEFLISTKEGKALLANYAAKGQTIAGVTFNKDGKFHKKGIDISFGTKTSRQFSSGSTFLTVKTNNMNIQVGVGKSSDIADLLDTFIHEIVIHADQSSIDFIDDRIMNNSNAYPALRRMNKSRNYTQHWQERNVNRAMERIGVPIIQQYYKSQGILKSNEVIMKMIYGFSNN